MLLFVLSHVIEAAAAAEIPKHLLLVINLQFARNENLVPSFGLTLPD